MYIFVNIQKMKTKNSHARQQFINNINADYCFPALWVDFNWVRGISTVKANTLPGNFSTEASRCVKMLKLGIMKAWKIERCTALQVNMKPLDKIGVARSGPQGPTFGPSFCCFPAPCQIVHIFAKTSPVCGSPRTRLGNTELEYLQRQDGIHCDAKDPQSFITSLKKQHSCPDASSYGTSASPLKDM